MPEELGDFKVHMIKKWNNACCYLVSNWRNLGKSLITGWKQKQILVHLRVLSRTVPLCIILLLGWLNKACVTDRNFPTLCSWWLCPLPASLLLNILQMKSTRDFLGVVLQHQSCLQKKKKKTWEKMEKQLNSAPATPLKHKMAPTSYTHCKSATGTQGHTHWARTHTHIISPPLPMAAGLFVFNSLLRGGNGDSVTAVILPWPQRTADQ